MTKVPLEFQDLISGADDDVNTPDVPDAFGNFLEEAALAGLGGGHEAIEKFRDSTADIDRTHSQIYKSIAFKVAQVIAPAVGDTSMRKRYGGSEKAIFRKYFQGRVDAGDTIAQILDKFTDQAKVEFSTELGELAEEFSGD
jgi:hypothetical protein